MIEEGTVTEIKQKRLIVDIKRSPACGSCRLCSVSQDRVIRLEVENTIGAKKGDKVKIEIDNKVILKSSMLFYLIPTVALLLGIFIGDKLAKTFLPSVPKEFISLLFGIALMWMAFIGVRWYNSIKGKLYKPRIVKG